MYIYVKSVINRFLNHRYYLHLQLTQEPTLTVLSLSFFWLGVGGCWNFWFQILIFLCFRIPFRLYIEFFLVTVASESLFPLSQDDINDAADDGEREGYPSQDVGISKGGRGTVPFRVTNGKDGRPGYHAYTCKELEDAGQVESSTFCKSEELAEEEKQGQDAKDYG